MPLATVTATDVALVAIPFGSIVVVGSAVKSIAAPPNVADN